MDAARILALLPWRHPFLLIDRVVHCAPHGRIVAERRITAGDPLVGDGSGGGSWFPSLLLVEGLGQTAALLHRLSYSDEAPVGLPMLGYLRASLHGSACPGDVVTFEVHPVKMTRRGGVFEGRALEGATLLAEAELALSADGGPR